MYRRLAGSYLSLIGVMLFGALAIVGCKGGSGGVGTSSPAVDNSFLYVSGVNVNSSSVLLSYNNANTVSGNATANRIATSGSTTLNAPRGIAIDMLRNQIYVANYANNSILVFDNVRSLSGGVAPDRTISAGTLSGPTALFIDAVNDRLYVASAGADSILIYDNASTLNGFVTPSRTVTGTATTLNAPSGIFVDTPRNLLYAANGTNQILVFNNADSIAGNVAPARTIDGLTNPGGIYVDIMADRLYAVNTGPSSVFIFDNASTATNITPPDRILSGGSSLLNQPRDVFVDTGADRLYVTNAADKSILVFNSASTVNNPAVPDRRLSPAPATTPWGVYVDVTPIVIGSTKTLDGYTRSDNTASDFGSPATGDKDASYLSNVGWRQLYSFDVASMPATATIMSATLRLYQCNIAGLPYAHLGNVLVDQVDYGNTLSAGAYNGMTVVSNIGTLSTTPTLGYRSLNVSARLQDDLSAARTASQYRLRFSLLDRFTNGTDDYVQFTDADDSLCAGTTTNQPPQLAVTLRP